MDAVAKEKWLEALESGKYPQDTGHLRTATGFCCLGVLCDVVGGGEWVSDRSGHGSETYEVEGEGVGDKGYVPQAVSDASGITLLDQRTLASINDGTRDGTFSDVADYIRESL